MLGKGICPDQCAETSHTKSPTTKIQQESGKEEDKEGQAMTVALWSAE